MHIKQTIRRTTDAENTSVHRARGPSATPPLAIRYNWTAPAVSPGCLIETLEYSDESEEEKKKWNKGCKTFLCQITATSIFCILKL